MCNNHKNTPRTEEKFKKRIQKLKGYAKALHCPSRWDIIDIIGEKEIRTRKIRQEMKRRDNELSKPGLYYHLSELKESGIIEVSGYIEEGKGAPEKKWKLNKKEITIKLTGES